MALDLSRMDGAVNSVLADWSVFPSPSPAPPWGMAIRRQLVSMLRHSASRSMRRIFGHSWLRDQGQILAEYDAQWRKKNWEKYRPRPLAGEGSAWVWGDLKFTLSNEAGAAVRLVYLEAALATLVPRNVLEVGCGNGINLHLLAPRLPGTDFVGLEPTPEGFRTADETAAQPLPEALKALAPFELRDLERRPAFVQGSAAGLPYPDGSFEVVITSLALEQMEQIRDTALLEIARVARRAVVFLEPFREVNGGLLRRRYVRTYDYFQGSIAELGRYGLAVSEAVTAMPHKAWLGTALVIAHKQAG